MAHPLVCTGGSAIGVLITDGCHELRGDWLQVGSGTQKATLYSAANAGLEDVLCVTSAIGRALMLLTMLRNKFGPKTSMYLDVTATPRVRVLRGLKRPPFAERRISNRN